MNRLIFWKSDRGLICITEDALSQLQSFRQTDPTQAEAGGLLMGRHIMESPDRIVDAITTPQPKDRRSRYAFFRSLLHNSIAEQFWRRSSETCTYLGSWHSHPEDDPTPSPQDFTDWKKALRRDVFEGDSLFFLIVGIKHMRVWQGQRNGTITELKPVDSDPPNAHGDDS